MGYASLNEYVGTDARRWSMLLIRLRQATSDKNDENQAMFIVCMTPCFWRRKIQDAPDGA